MRKTLLGGDAEFLSFLYIDKSNVCVMKQSMAMKMVGEKERAYNGKRNRNERINLQLKALTARLENRNALDRSLPLYFQLR